MKSFRQFIEEDEDVFEIFSHTDEQWDELSEEEKAEFVDFEIDGEFEAPNGSIIWIVGGEEYDIVNLQSVSQANESIKFKGRSRRQVHMTQIKKRRFKGRDRAKKLKRNIHRRKSHVKFRIKRNEFRRTQRHGAGDKSGKRGKIGQARKRRGGRNISYKG